MWKRRKEFREINNLTKMRDACKEKLENCDSPYDRERFAFLNDLIVRKKKAFHFV